MIRLRALATCVLLALAVALCHGCLQGPYRFFPAVLQEWLGESAVVYEQWEIFSLLILALAAVILPAPALSLARPVESRRLCRQSYVPLALAAVVWLIGYVLALCAPLSGASAMGVWGLFLAAGVLLLPKGERPEGRGVRRLVIGSALLCALHVVLWGSRLLSWRLALIGDEYGFFEFSVEISRSFGSEIFAPSGHFSFPRLSNIAQGAAIGLFGGDLFAFRLSGVLPITLSIPAVVWAARSIVRPPAALLAGLFLALDPLSAAIGSIGYNNSQMLPIWCWSAAFALYAFRTGSLRAAAAAGIVSGLGYYTPYISMICVATSFPLLVGLSWLLGRTRDATDRAVLARQSAPFFLGFLAAAGPILLRSGELLQNMAERAPPRWILSRVPGQAINTLLSPLFFAAQSHNLAGRVFLPTVGALSIFGFFLCLRRWGWPSTIFVAANALLLAVAAGVVAPYYYPSVTRILVISGPVAILGGVGAQAVLEAFSAALYPHRRLEAGRSRRFAQGWVVAALAILCGSDLVLRQRVFCNRAAVTAVAHVVRVGLNLPSGKVLYFVPSSTSVELLQTVLGYYKLQEKVVVIRVPLEAEPFVLPHVAEGAIAVIHHNVARRQRVLDAVGWGDGEASKGWEMKEIATREGALFAYPLSESAAEGLKALSSPDCPNPFSAD